MANLYPEYVESTEKLFSSMAPLISPTGFDKKEEEAIKQFLDDSKNGAFLYYIKNISLQLSVPDPDTGHYVMARNIFNNIFSTSYSVTEFTEIINTYSQDFQIALEEIKGQAKSIFYVDSRLFLEADFDLGEIAAIYATFILNIVYKYGIVFQDNEVVKERLFATINAIELCLGITISEVANIDENSIVVKSHFDLYSDEDIINENPKALEDVSQEVAEDGPTDIESLLTQLNGLIGLDSLKKDIANIVNMMNVQQMRKEKGLPLIPMSNHLVFLGNPGTGKTTIARLVSKIYKALGILSKGHLIEIDRSGLVAGYVGQTALKTDEVIKSAIGGVLFIDEAYTLANDDFGKEAIDILLKRMEDYRDDFIVVVAGYPENMSKFIQTNPGLESRFNKYIYFDDYTPEELTRIFAKMCEDNGYTIDLEALNKVQSYAVAKFNIKDDSFANARLMRNLFEKIISNQANRIVLMNSPTIEELSLIKLEDVELK